MKLGKGTMKEMRWLKKEALMKIRNKTVGTKVKEIKRDELHERRREKKREEGDVGSL